MQSSVVLWLYLIFCDLRSLLVSSLSQQLCWYETSTALVRMLQKCNQMQLGILVLPASDILQHILGQTMSPPWDTYCIVVGVLEWEIDVKMHHRKYWDSNISDTCWQKKQTKNKKNKSILLTRESHNIHQSAVSSGLAVFSSCLWSGDLDQVFEIKACWNFTLTCAIWIGNKREMTYPYYKEIAVRHCYD